MLLTDFTHLVVLDGQLRSLCSQEESLCLLEFSLLKGKLCLSHEHISHAVWVVSLGHTLCSVPVLVVHKPGRRRRSRDSRCNNKDDKEQPSVLERPPGWLELHGEDVEGTYISTASLGFPALMNSPSASSNLPWRRRSDLFASDCSGITSCAYHREDL